MSQIAFNREGFSDEELKDIYLKLVRPRLIEEKMLILLRQGKITKWFSASSAPRSPVATQGSVPDALSPR